MDTEQLQLACVWVKLSNLFFSFCSCDELLLVQLCPRCNSGQQTVSAVQGRLLQVPQGALL